MPQSFWHGSQSEIAFLSDLYDLHDLHSNDHRFKTAYEDLTNAFKWGDITDESWVFDDPRFEFMSGSDEVFLNFVAHTLHPRVRKDSTKQTNMLKQLNILLNPCGYELYETISETGLDIFTFGSTSMVSDIKSPTGDKSTAPIKSKMVGEGSYAIVHSYTDTHYGIRFAVKKARKDLDDREKERFRLEFKTLEKLSSPYVVEVYRYDESRNEYLMEFCDQTLEAFIKTRNNRLTFIERKRIALQFLSGLNHIHSKGYFHRDLSYRNVLVKIYDDDQVLVKISDLGLVKDPESNLTRTGTEIRGTLVDPLLGSFGDFGLQNEMWSIGLMLQYIFTGRENLTRSGRDDVHQIIQKCTSTTLSDRYDKVLDVITEVEALVD